MRNAWEHPLCAFRALCGKKSSSDKVFVEFMDKSVHLVTEELVHFAEAALGVEGGEVEVVALDAAGGHDVVADELGPGCLGFVKWLTGVLFQDPIAVVAADGFVEGVSFASMPQARRIRATSAVNSVGGVAVSGNSSRRA